MKIKYLVLSSLFLISCGLIRLSNNPPGPPSPRVIANWDLVPNQIIPFSDPESMLSISSPFKAGVVAFHEAGVNVDFSINGGTVQRKYSPEYNDRTGVWEYFIEIDASAYDDRPITLSATAYSDTGSYLPKKLEDITLYMNSNGTYDIGTKIKYADSVSGNDSTGDGSSGSPYASLEKAYDEVGSGGIVYLKEGTYSAVSITSSKNYNMWTTITRDPDSTTSKEDVIITNGNFHENNVHWHEVSLQRDDIDSYSTALSFDKDQTIWISSVDINGHNKDKEGDSFNVQKSNIYLTDSTIHDISNAFSTTHFARNIDVNNIGADVIRAENDQVFLNITVDTVIATGTTAHCDIIQIESPGEFTDNIILYNVKVTNMEAQGIFGTADSEYATNLAFINIMLNKPAISTRMSQIQNMSHVLLWHFTSHQSGFSVSTPGSVSNLHFYNNIFYSFSAQGETSLNNSEISNNNFTTGDPFGTDYTTEDPNYNASLIPQNSIQSGISLECVPADIDGRPRTSGQIGAINYD